MTIKFSNEEIDWIVKSMIDEPLVANTLKVISKLMDLSKEWRYPIQDFDEFIENINLKDITTLENQKIKLSDLKNMIQPKFFPIANEEECQIKFTNLYNATITHPLTAAVVDIHPNVVFESVPPIPQEFLSLIHKVEPAGVVFRKLSDDNNQN
jgi:hypothetical protein